MDVQLPYFTLIPGEVAHCVCVCVPVRWLLCLGSHTSLYFAGDRHALLGIMHYGLVTTT